jgi:hypothetical protein
MFQMFVQYDSRIELKHGPEIVFSTQLSEYTRYPWVQHAKECELTEVDKRVVDADGNEFVFYNAHLPCNNAYYNRPQDMNFTLPMRMKNGVGQTLKYRRGIWEADRKNVKIKLFWYLN